MRCKPRLSVKSPSRSLLQGICFLRLQGVCFLREAPERAIGSDRRAGKRGLFASPASVPIKVEFIPVQACKSTTRHISPRMIRDSPNSFTAGLLRKDPLLSQRIQLKPSNFPTLIGQEIATNDAPLFDNDLGKIYRLHPERATSFGSLAIIYCPFALAARKSSP